MDQHTRDELTRISMLIDTVTDQGGDLGYLVEHIQYELGTLVGTPEWGQRVYDDNGQMI